MNQKHKGRNSLHMNVHNRDKRDYIHPSQGSVGTERENHNIGQLNSNTLIQVNPVNVINRIYLVGEISFLFDQQIN